MLLLTHSHSLIERKKPAWALDKRFFKWTRHFSIARARTTTTIMETHLTTQFHMFALLITVLSIFKYILVIYKQLPTS